MNLANTILGGAFGLLLLSISSCHAEGPQTGSQTNWLKVCAKPSDCEDFDCICGVCTTSCNNASSCEGLTGATCFAKGEPGTIAACDGQPADSGMCLPECDSQTCSPGNTCVAGACVGNRKPTATGAIDPSTKHQSLIGFGASLAGSEAEIASHPEKAALYDAMFLESGLEMIRFGNQFEGDADLDLSALSEIISAADSRIGSEPVLFMTSGSPPAALKANGSRVCSNADVDCTLVRDGQGDFDYAAFAEHWRASLETYEDAGIHPNFVSIQNTPDFVPAAEEQQEACRFLASEGTLSVTTPDGTMVDAEFAGYSEAMTAVTTAVRTLPDSYSFSGPEVGSAVLVGQYVDSLELTESLSFHLYLAKPDDVLVTHLESVRDAAETAGIPVIQSQMSAAGLDTALLTQMALTFADASVYVQEAFVGNDFAEESAHLIGLDETSFRTLPAYHAMAHFARSTAPGWIRVGMNLDSSEVLSSAWMSPEEDAITIILVNPTADAENVELVFPSNAASLLENASVLRTVFDGVERSADLGQLSEKRVIRLPGKSIVTVASRRE